MPENGTQINLTLKGFRPIVGKILTEWLPFSSHGTTLFFFRAICKKISTLYRRFFPEIILKLM